MIISAGSVAPFSGDAIVNAANRRCLGGGGVDGAVSDAGGEPLYQARLALPIKEGTKNTRVETGDAAITVGGELPASYCIHAVGPDYYDCEDDAEGDSLLYSAYEKGMQLAQQQTEPAIKTIAFSLLSAGIFRDKRSLKEVLRIAVKAVKANAWEGLKEVHLVAWKEVEQRILIKVCEEERGEEGGLGEEVEEEGEKKRKGEEKEAGVEREEKKVKKVEEGDEKREVDCLRLD
ncbi:hypothetical protein TL16_g10610 [Triparma laevis f. inornata]|uniref:Macro domain-containing protein n=1 Tax=Triparma laevis f. inornata TaxID=1714386 RepID=A0A9W7B982_9STRA|nr:hypothetical protein TL16_g10610 [Triparma laevis f. inornata]